MEDLFQQMISLSAVVKEKRREERSHTQEVGASLQTIKSELTETKRESSCYNEATKKLTQNIEKMKQEVDKKLKCMEAVRSEFEAEKTKNMQTVNNLQDKQTASQKMYPRARYSVNLYRDVSRIRWQTDEASNNVIGFANGKKSSQSFRFDSSKQSQFFITNALWDMTSETA